MSDPSKQNVEEQLQALARQRRSALGQPLELHPENRQSLHRAVAKAYATPESARNAATPVAWLAGLWIRFAFAALLLAGLAMTAVYWLPRPGLRPLELAAVQESSAPPRQGTMPSVQSFELNEADGTVPAGRRQDNEIGRLDGFGGGTPTLAPRSADEKNTAPPTPRGVSPIPVQELEMSFRQSTAPLRVTLAPSPVPSMTESVAPPPASVASTPGIGTDLQKSRSIAQADAGRAAVVQAVAPVAKQEAATAADSFQAPALPAEARPAETVWNFRQNEAASERRRNFNSPPTPQVLISFQFQQTGRSVRLIDEDGSVYEGAFAEGAARDNVTAVSSTSQDGRGRGGRAASATRRREADSSVASLSVPQTASPVGIPFQVSGTNRTLRQNIVFTGTLETLAAPAGGRGGGSSAGRGGGRGPGAAPRLELQGKALIGRSMEIPIQAEVIAP